MAAERVGREATRVMENHSQLRILNKKDESRARGLNRRQVVQRLLGTAGAGVMMPGLAAGHPVRSHLMSESTMAEAETKAADPAWEPLFLDAHQNDTVTVLAERIVPNSTQAQVNRFIDLLLSVDTQENQKKFLASLGAFEHEALVRYGRPFKDLSEEQQNEILTVASTEKPGAAGENANWSWFAVPTKEGGEAPTLTLRDHFENIKGWVVGAFYSSEVGMKELGWTGQVMWESFPGCEHPDGHA
jgi:hypothetical protein